MKKDKLALFDPDEDSEQVLKIYSKALGGNPDKYY
jgi:hypothetical protein